MIGWGLLAWMLNNMLERRESAFDLYDTSLAHNVGLTKPVPKEQQTAA